MGMDAVRADWLRGLRAELFDFVASLRCDARAGRFVPCRNGMVRAGREARLGFSCFAKKILDATGTWMDLPERERQEWLDFIRSFQVLSGADAASAGRIGLFVDPGLMRFVQVPTETLKGRVRRLLSGRPLPDLRADIRSSETKQAIATLAWSGERPTIPFGGFPCQKEALLTRLRGLDWRQPWTAGAMSALLALFVQSQGPLLAGVDQSALRQTLADFLAGMADPASGAYFQPPTPPARGQLINGAMKVLNALEWLEEPIHHPERLIDTCLLQGPPPAGCHVVDWVYVLYRCLKQTDHRRREVQARVLALIDLIRTHQNADHGFSYEPGRAQTGYYGAIISRGLNEGDIHGSALLAWALAMIVEILEWDLPGWRSYRA
ncbi:MAG: hypothetical protein HQL91_12555 [Magnetococcales bacterium]|nr:hypothetical protein [Magnetococcales bacterium]